MQGKYLIVDKSLLPSYFEKVAEAKELIDEAVAELDEEVIYDNSSFSLHPKIKVDFLYV